MAFVLIAVFALIAAAVFIVTKNLSVEKAGEGELLFPRVALNPDAVDEDMASLRERAADFEPDEEEARLVKLIGDIHRSEVGGEVPAAPDAGPGLGTRDLVQRFRETARPLYRKDPERFLLLGERLALEFSDALDAVLSLAKRQGLQATLDHGGEQAERLVQAGGGFVTMGVARGLISDDGELHASRLLPQVLFRRKWCAMAGYERQARLSETEELVNLDFIAAFGGGESVGLRVGAIEQLGKTRDDYDADLAEAMARRDAGDLIRAVTAMEKVVAASPDAVAARAALEEMKRSLETKSGD